MSKCYSINDNDFTFDSIEDAAGEIRIELGRFLIGQLGVIWEADKIKDKASSLLPDIVNHISSAASFDREDQHEFWRLAIAKERNQIQYLIANALDEYMDENQLQPEYYGVRNIKMITIRFTSNTGDFEIINQTIL